MKPKIIYTFKIDIKKTLFINNPLLNSKFNKLGINPELVYKQYNEYLKRNLNNKIRYIEVKIYNIKKFKLKFKLESLINLILDKLNLSKENFFKNFMLQNSIKYILLYIIIKYKYNLLNIINIKKEYYILYNSFKHFHL